MSEKRVWRLVVFSFFALSNKPANINQTDRLTESRFLHYPNLVIPDILIPVSLVLFAYLMGSIPVGVIIGKLKGIDPRKTGSGNIGATNVMRAAGKALGIVTLICDVAKGYIPVALTVYMGEWEYIVAIVGFAVFLGHLFPVFLKFRGGKGVATALGVYIALGPLAVLGGLIVFIIVFIIWRYVSLASLAGAIAIPLALYLVKAPYEFIILGAVIAVFVIIRHKDNITRLVKGTEHKISFSGNSGKS